MGYDKVLLALKKMLQEEEALAKALPMSGQEHVENANALRVAVSALEAMERGLTE